MFYRPVDEITTNFTVYTFLLFITALVVLTIYIVSIVRYNEFRLKNTMDIKGKIDYSNELLKLIDDMIAMEIVSNQKRNIYTNGNIPAIKLDIIVSEVSTTVFKNLNEKICFNGMFIFTDEYIMSYIQKKTTMVLIEMINGTSGE